MLIASLENSFIWFVVLISLDLLLIIIITLSCNKKSAYLEHVQYNTSIQFSQRWFESVSARKVRVKFSHGGKGVS